MTELVLIRVTGADKPGLTSNISAMLAQYGVTVLDIGQQRVARVLRERQLRRPSTLAVHAQQRIGPIYVGEPELAHVPGAKPEAG